MVCMRCVYSGVAVAFLVVFVWGVVWGWDASFAYWRRSGAMFDPISLCGVVVEVLL